MSTGMSEIRILRTHGKIDGYRASSEVEPPAMATDMPASWIMEVLDELVSVLLHEARGSLTTVNGWAQVLELGGHDEDTLAEASSTLKTAVAEQSGLFRVMDDFLALARGQRLERTLIDLRSILAEASEPLLSKAASAGVRTAWEVIDGPILVQADPQRCARVAGALMTAAIAQNRVAGEVRVSLTTEGSYARLLISDAGPRLVSDSPPCSFDRLQRVCDPGSSRRANIDLRLAYARAVVEDLGGSVAAWSPCVGQGAHLQILIPLDSESRA
jgi:signal transduction histidine kinase